MPSLQFGSLGMLPRESVLYLVVHTQGAPNNSDGSAQAIHRYHRAPVREGGRGWAGIGYHRVVRQGGSVEDGRPLDRMGAHVNGMNQMSVGVCCSGNGDLAEFTPVQAASLIDLLRDLQSEFPRAQIVGHRGVVDRLIGAGQLAARFRTSKSCPGKKIRLDAILQAVGGPTAAPRLGERRWSKHLGEAIVLTRYAADDDWSFLPESELRKLGIRAGARWSELPPATS